MHKTIKSSQSISLETLAADAVPYTPSGVRSIGVDPPPSQSALHRWRLAGLRGVRPDTFLRGGRRYITPAALHAFFAALTAAADRSGPAARSPRRAEKEIQKANTDLEGEFCK